MTAVVIVLAVAVGLLGVATAVLIRGQAMLTRAVQDLQARLGPPPAPATPRRSLTGQPAPPISGLDWSASRRWVALFLTSGCATCRPVWQGLASTAGSARVVVVTPDPSTESHRDVAALVADRAEVVMSSEAWTGYGVRGAPWAVVVGDGAVLGEAGVGSWEEIVTLAGDAV